ncbi:MAG: hypothetical protein M3Z85_17835 [Acidobacteriota bacterium]|nr:hypothetical protein [Acidobacteriota bacterium]
MFAAGILLTLSFAQVVMAEDRLKDFQTAINYMQDEQGCLSIPYADLQDSCQRKQNEVNKYCKESGPSSCVDIDPKKIQKDIEAAKTSRDALKSQREDLERKRSSATDDREKRDAEDKIKEVDDKLYELKKTQESLEKQVSDTTKMLSDRLYIAKACRDSRPPVQSVFNDAKSRAAGESDAEIKPLAERLIRSWEDRGRTHEEAIKNASNAVENCDKVLYEIGHIGNF